MPYYYVFFLYVYATTLKLNNQAR